MLYNKEIENTLVASPQSNTEDTGKFVYLSITVKNIMPARDVYAGYPLIEYHMRG